MREPTSLMRRALTAAAMLAVTGMPLAAQANTSTTSTSALVAQDSTRRAPVDDDRGGFPWGLLGLLGLAGLMGRRKVETVRTVPPATARPGEPISRM